MTLPPAPEDWGDEGLSQFADMSRQNVFWHRVHNRSVYDRLSGINGAFRLIGEHISHPPDWFVALFLLRTHSSYLGSTQLALAGQVPETYMVLRGCLENALYAYYFQANPASHQRWLERHSSDAALKAVRDEFKVGRMLSGLRAAEPKLGAAVTTLYERTIDRGAHPNERALSQVARFSEDDEEQTYQVGVMYLISPDTRAARLAVKSTAQTGIAALKVFREIMRERFDLIGLTEKIEHLQDGL